MQSRRCFGGRGREGALRGWCIQEHRMPSPLPWDPVSVAGREAAWLSLPPASWRERSRGGRLLGGTRALSGRCSSRKALGLAGWRGLAQGSPACPGLSSASTRCQGSRLTPDARGSPCHQTAQTQRWLGGDSHPEGKPPHRVCPNGKGCSRVRSCPDFTDGSARGFHT